MMLMLVPSSANLNHGRNSEMRTIRVAPPAVCSARLSRRTSGRNSPAGAPAAGMYRPARLSGRYCSPGVRGYWLADELGMYRSA